MNKKYKIQERESDPRPLMGLLTGLVLVMLNSLTSCTHPNAPFYTKVLSDFGSPSYFIALNIKSPSYEGRAIIENNNLFEFLHKTKGLSMKKYQAMMLKVLEHKRELKISDEDLNKWHFFKVSEPESVIMIANRGLNNFIAYYFNGVALNWGVTDEEKYAIINQLFYWRVPARTDKVSGILMIG
jgi:hypothetical protein